MNIENTLASINNWHRLARPKPDDKAMNVQIGVHFEEIAEMLEPLKGSSDEFDYTLQRLYEMLTHVAGQLKRNQAGVTITNRKLFADSLADQVVTGIGVGYCAGIDTPLTIERVDISNWSKFVNGQPVFNEYGKIAKPATYREPDLEGCY